MIYTPNHLQIRIFNYLCRPKWKCGEIWLLATTLKNAKMLTERSSCPVTDIISMFCVFVTAPHSCGAFFMPGALPLYTPRPLRLHDFLRKSRPGRASDDAFICQGRCPFTPRGLCASTTFYESPGPAGRLMTPFYARGAERRRRNKKYTIK